MIDCKGRKIKQSFHKRRRLAKQNKDEHDDKHNDKHKSNKVSIGTLPIYTWNLHDVSLWTVKYKTMIDFFLKNWHVKLIKPEHTHYIQIRLEKRIIQIYEVIKQKKSE